MYGKDFFIINHIISTKIIFGIFLLNDIDSDFFDESIMQEIYCLTHGHLCKTCSVVHLNIFR